MAEGRRLVGVGQQLGERKKEKKSEGKGRRRLLGEEIDSGFVLFFSFFSPNWPTSPLWTPCFELCTSIYR